MKLLSKVKDVLRIGGRGWVVILDKPESALPIDDGDPLQLRRPDGSAVDTQIVSVDIVKLGEKAFPPWKQNEDIFFLLPDSLKKTDMPAGTEVWLSNKS